MVAEGRSSPFTGSPRISSGSEAKTPRPWRSSGESSVISSIVYSEQSQDQVGQVLLTDDQVAQAKASPVRFAELCSGGWYHRAPHLDMLDDYLLKLHRREIKRLMVFMPPRHSKSETVSHFFTDWWVVNSPDDNVILASYGQEKADEWGRSARDTLEEYR